MTIISHEDIKSITDGLAGGMEQYLDNCRGDKTDLIVTRGAESPIGAHNGVFHRYADKGLA